MVEILCIGIQRLVPVAIASRLSGLSDFQRSPPNATTLSVSDFQNLRSFPHLCKGNADKRIKVTLTFSFSVLAYRN